jgi:K+-sensing histidine kinase KdpD
VAIAGIIRWTIGIFVDGVVPFAAFFPAALFAAFVGGIGPGIFAALLGGVIGWWAFLDPPRTFFPLTVAQQISLIFYFLTSLVIVWAADHYRKVTKRLEDEETFRELAVEELAHRLKNKVATIQSIISLRLREDPQTRDEIIKPDSPDDPRPDVSIRTGMGLLARPMRGSGGCQPSGQPER